MQAKTIPDKKSLNFIYPPKNSKEISEEIVIVGSGIAGLSCALALKELGLRPLIITKSQPSKNLFPTTYLAQGGIACALSDEDGFYLHYLDTLKVGKLLNDKETTYLLCSEGRKAIAKLISWGVEFDRNQEFYALTIEAGHSKRRILRIKDYTGKKIFEVLYQRVREEEIPIIENTELLEIYTSKGKVIGLLALKGEEEYLFIRTKFLVLATGGGADLYEKHTPFNNFGGKTMATALRGGAVLRDMEFIQFHPTVLEGTNHLISEAVRGEGAVLINSQGERFINELLPRDEVARAIFNQQKAGKRVFLDFSPIVKKGIKIEERFPQIYEKLKKEGYDPYRELIPVSPAAHYFIGGIATDSFGKTTIKNLYAVGECANTGVHGANRLASNSLLEGVVFALRVAEDIFLKMPFTREEKYSIPFSEKEIKNSWKWMEDYKTLKKEMWNKAGLIRDGENLSEMFQLIEELQRKYYPCASEDVSCLRFLDILLTAKAVVISALQRQESRGCHYRKDYPYEREIYRSLRNNINWLNINIQANK